MYGQSILVVLMSLFVAIVTSQSTECTNAVQTLEANQACNNAYNDFLRFVGLSRDSLNMYCQPSCYDLIGAIIRACSGDDAASRFYYTRRFTCAINPTGVSCLNYTLYSAEYRSLVDAFWSSGICPNTVPDGQTCSQTCQSAFQNLVIDGGCCIGESVRILQQNADDANLVISYYDGSITNIATHCPVDTSRAGTCMIIGGANIGSGGANGLKAFGSVLLFTVTFALATF